MLQSSNSQEGSAQDILRATAPLLHSGTVTEVRVLGSGRGIVSGYYNNIHALARDAAYYSGKAKGVYWTLNPCRPELLSRALNRLREFTHHGETTSDNEIADCRWLLIDVDARRPSGISATDEEHQAAFDLARRVERYLHREHNFPY